MTETGKKISLWAARHRWLLTALAMSLLPLLCCMAACAAQGKTIADVYIPAGEWNDELFYYKQVEGIVKFGYPQGFFGFNESHALKASFAAWSPVLVFPWILWGLIFGWNLHSPIYCNLFLMMLSMFVFVRLVKPGRKQLGILTVLYVCFYPLTRYMLSGMPECICFSLAIVFLALGISYQEKEHPVKLFLLFLISALLTLMRPYFLLFLVLPSYYWIRKNKWLGALGSVGIAGVTLTVYAVVKHYFGAEYFTPLFDTTWVTTFLDQGIFAGIKYVIWRLLHVGADYTKLMIEGFRSGLYWGENFGAFTAVTVILFIQTVHNIRKKQKNQLICNLNLLFCCVGMWAALLLMYKMREGSKHLLVFIVAGIFAISLMETRFYKKMVFAAVVFVYLFAVKGTDTYEYQIPFQEDELLAESAYWKQVFAEKLTLEQEETPNFDNVVIWVFSDTTEEGSVITRYQMLYQLPEGFGISCCYADYAESHFDQLESKYLATVDGGSLDSLCQEKGAREIGRNEGLVVYELR